MADCVLVNPPNPGYYELFPHLGLQYIASAARSSGISAVIVDAPYEELSREETVQAALRYDPRVVGISAMYQATITETIAIADQLRLEGFGGHITAGGVAASLQPENLLLSTPSINTVVTGEGEHTFTELVSKLTSIGTWQHTIPGICWLDQPANVVRTRAISSRLDALPFPEVGLLSQGPSDGSRRALLSTSRGCVGKCSYCSSSTFSRLSKGPPWRAHSPERVISDIKRLVGELGMQSVRIVDDDFIGPGSFGRRRCWEIVRQLARDDVNCSLIVETRADRIEPELFKALKSVGLRRVFLGVEAVVPDMLAEFNKTVTVAQNIQAMEVLDRLGIDYDFGFMLISPDSTLTHVQAQIEFLLSCKRTSFFNVAPLEPFPGTSIFDRLMQQRRLCEVGSSYRITWDRKPKEGQVYSVICQGYDKLLKLNIEFMKRYMQAERAQTPVIKSHTQRCARMLAAVTFTFLKELREYVGAQKKSAENIAFDWKKVTTAVTNARNVVHERDLTENDEHLEG